MQERKGNLVPRYFSSAKVIYIFLLLLLNFWRVCMLDADCIPIFFKAAFFFLWFDWSISGKLGFLFGSRTLKINRTFMFSNSTLWAERHLEEVILLVGRRNLTIFCLQRTGHLVTLLLDP